MMNTILSPTESIDDVKTKGPLPLPVQLYWVILIVTNNALCLLIVVVLQTPF